MLLGMDDQRLGSLARAVRHNRGLRQVDVAAAAGVSASFLSLIERGHLDAVSVRTLRRVLATLDFRVDLVGRWRGGDADRLLNARHSALHESVARFLESMPAWLEAPEVSFSIFGERGVIDILAWHAERRVLVVIELKTEIVDVQALIGTVDRCRRLAPQIARDRGWPPRAVSSWVIVEGTRTNRWRVAAHAAFLRSAYPLDGRAMAAWLRDPAGSVAALSFWTQPRETASRGRKRIRKSPTGG
jgi:transcriptional regulator with XRE-family HTH domain